MSARTDRLGLFRSFAASILALVIAGCSSGHSGGDSASGTIISGVAAAGLVAGGTVSAYKVVDGTKTLPALASATTDGAGNYAVNLGAYTGAVLLELTGGTYVDEASGTTLSLGTTLRAVVPAAPTTTTVSITPLTEAAIINAAASPGGMTATNVNSAYSAILGFLGFNPLTTAPVIATSSAAATASNPTKAYGAYLAGLSQYLVDNPTKTLSGAISDYALAFGAGGLQNVPAITTSQNAFLSRNSNNLTGIATYAALQSLIPTTSRQIQSIAISPSSFSLATSGAKQLTATGSYSDGTQADVTGIVTWSSSAPSVATVSSSGLAFGVATGSATISASLGTAAGTTTAAVTSVTLKSISVSPNPRTGVGGTTQLLATGTYSDASTGDLTASVSWSSDSPQTATVGASGRATGVSLGTAGISAKLGALAGTSTLSVVAPKFAYVTNFFGNSVGIYSINSTSGALTPVQLATAGSGPVAVSVEAMGRVALVANTGSNNVSSFTIDQSTGALTAVSTVSAGTSPSAIVVDPSGRYVYVANRDSNSVSVFALNATTGVLTSAGSAATGAGPNSLAVDPTGRFLYVANSSASTVSVYVIAPATGALTSGTTVATASSPTSVVVHPSGRFAYITMAGNSVWAYAMDQSTGALSAGKGITSATTIAVDPGGRYLFAAVSSLNAAIAYVINQVTGYVEGGSRASSQASPTALAADATGRFLYLCNAGLNNVWAYSIDQGNGTLTAVGSVTTGSGPQAVAIW